MRMLLIVFRNSLEDEVRMLLKGLDVKAYTELPKVAGIGETGTAFGSFEWPDYNSLILVALTKGKADQVLKGLKTFQIEQSSQQPRGKIPLRVFVLPCLQVV